MRISGVNVVREIGLESTRGAADGWLDQTAGIPAPGTGGRPAQGAGVLVAPKALRGDEGDRHHDGKHGDQPDRTLTCPGRSRRSA